MGEILVDVARIDDEEVFFCLKAIEIRVVDGTAILIGNDAVLRLIDVKRLHVAGQDVLQKPHHVRPFDVDTAHVGHVENGAVAAAVEMLGDDAVRVLDGHIPAAEIDHRGPSVQMGLIEYGSFQFAHGVPPVFLISRRLCACGYAVLR